MNAEMNVNLECSWPLMGNANLVQEEHTGILFEIAFLFIQPKTDHL